MTSPSDLGLAQLFRAARRRLRLAWLAATGNTVVPALGGLAVALVLIGWLMPWTWPEPVAVVTVVGGLIMVAGWAVAFPVPDAQVARALERGLDRRDSITSALEVDPANPFAGRLHQRVADLSTPDAGRAIKLPFRWRPLAIGLALLAAAAVLAIVRNPADDDRDRLAAERAAVVAAAEEVEERAEELADDPATADLAADLEALAEELANEQDLDRARERLEEASAELAARTDAGTLAQRAASLGLSRTLESRPLSPSSGGATPSEQLAQLADDVDGLSDEELADLAERLAELAETQQAGDPETAEALAAAAEAAAAGDQAGLASALGAASASAGAAASDAQAGLANDSAAADLDRLSDELADAADGQGEGDGQGQGDGAGEGQGQGQGSGSGEGQGQGQGQGGSASGTVGGASASGNDPSATGGVGQVGQGDQGDAGESATHPEAEVVVPEGGASDQLSASAQATGDNTTADPTRVDGATTSGQASVPVREVVTDYRSRAVAALDDLRLAPSETDAVQSYFDRLAEATGAN